MLRAVRRGGRDACLQIEVVWQMAGNGAVACDRMQLRLHAIANLHPEGAPWMETAAGRYVHGTRHLPADHLHPAARLGVRRGNAREQRHGVRMTRGREDLAGAPGSTMRPRYMTATRQRRTPRRRDHARPTDRPGQALLQIHKQRQDTGLNRNVQSRRRLIQDQQLDSSAIARAIAMR